VHRVGSVPADRLGPFPVTDLPRSLVDTWGLAHSRAAPKRSVEGVRAAVITCLRDRRVTAGQLRRTYASRPTLPGRAALEQLLGLIEQGCESELEIWGVRHVLQGEDMPRFVQQHRVALRFGTVHLDAAVPELLVDVEMDGMAFHDSPQSRERDRRRDVALAALGWVVLRFSYRRLTEDPAGCRREILAVCRAREAQLARRR
jgi:very-short-patch-repair endonuclease